MQILLQAGNYAFADDNRCYRNST